VELSNVRDVLLCNCTLFAGRKLSLSNKLLLLDIFHYKKDLISISPVAFVITEFIYKFFKILIALGFI
jgi:hypothetical protein